MLENCATIDSCETILSEQILQVSLLGQLPLTNNDYGMLCNYVAKEFSFSTNSGFQDEITNYPATLASYLVLKGIFNYSEGAYWNSVKDDIKEFNPAKSQMLGKAFLRFIENNGLFRVEIPRSQKYLTPILMHGIIPQEQVQEYFDKIIYHLVTKELICPTDTVELSDWLNENRNTKKAEERLRALDKTLQEVPDDFLDDDDIDLDTVYSEIDALETQINTLSDELKSLERSDEQFENYQMLKHDIVKAKSLETDLSLLHQKKEDVSNRILTLSQSYEQNIFSSLHRETLPPSDTITANAETELINHLSHIAKRGSPEEKEKLKEFIQSFSDGVTNHSIRLSNEAMEKYQTFLSTPIPYLPFDDMYEFVDISASHARSLSAATDQELARSELPLHQTETANACLQGGFQSIQSWYDIEDIPSDVWITGDTPRDDTLSLDTPVSSDDGIAIHPLTEPVIQEKPSEKPEIGHISLPVEGTDSVAGDRDHIPLPVEGTDSIPDDRDHIPLPAEGTDSIPGDRDHISPLLEAPDSIAGETVSADIIESASISSNFPPEFGNNSESLFIQTVNEQNGKNNYDYSVSEPTDNNHALTAEGIRKIRDELLEACSVHEDIQKHAEDTESKPQYDRPILPTGPGTPPNIPERNNALFEEQTTSEKEGKTLYNSELVSLIKDKVSDKSLPESEFDGSSIEYADTAEKNSVQELCDINLIELAGIGDEFSVENLADKRNAANPTKEPTGQKPYQHAISLADDPKIPRKIKRKSIISRLIDILFRKSR